MKRVMIVGQPGSGKSWLARRIGDRTGLPVHHMDQIHWKPGWVERARAAKIAMAHAIEHGDAWVFEGSLSATYDHRLSRCDTLIVLDLPLPLRLWRVLSRTLTSYGRTRPDLPEGCPERFSAEFLSYIWRTRHTNRARIRQLAETAPSDTAVHHLTSRAEVTRFLAEFGATASEPTH